MLNGSADPSAAGAYAYTGSYALESGETYWPIAGIDADKGCHYH